MRRLLLTLALFVCFRWVDASGTIGFADDLTRVPERYRASAERVVIEGGLDAYGRFTPSSQ